MSLRWKGGAVNQKMKAAIVQGMNTTISDCIRNAKQLVHRRTATLQGSIRMKPVVREGGAFVGRWGSFDVNYAIYQEMLPPEKGGKAYLRPSADRHYPELGRNIRKALEGQP